MRAQVSLIPTESKKLIAKAVAGMSEVQKAFKKGIVAMHPSSSTIFIAEELTGKVPDTLVWVSGIVATKGACGSESSGPRSPQKVSDGRLARTYEFLHTWVIEGGKLKSGIPLGEILDRMGPDDIYIKGGNAIDFNGTVGVLIGNEAEGKAMGGTIGLVMSRRQRQGFKVIFPVGLEKLIPTPMKQAAKEAAQRNSLTYSMGTPCALLPCEGIVVTEPKAIEILTGAEAIPIGAGGLGGAEGAITMIIKGEDDAVTKAIRFVEGVKGTKLPREVRVRDCNNCERERCSLRGANKAWC